MCLIVCLRLHMSSTELGLQIWNFGRLVKKNSHHKDSSLTSAEYIKACKAEPGRRGTKCFDLGT